MVNKLIIESYVTLSEGRRITGLALLPRISLNRNFYMPAELERADGKTVPLNYEHDTTKVPIGQVTFHYDKELMQLRYEGYVTDEAIAKELAHKTMHVSIGADVEEVGSICDAKSCYDVPRGLTFRELSLVEAPGIPESTVIIIEKCTWKHKCENSVIEPMGQYKDWDACKADGKSDEYCGSLKAKTEDNSINVISKQLNILTSSKTEEPAKTEPSKEMDHGECPEGQVMKDGKCVAKEEVKKEDCGCSKKAEVDLSGTWANKDDIHRLEKELADMKANAKEIINKTTESELKRLDSLITADKIGKSDQIARISAEAGGFKVDDIKTISEAMVPALRKYGYYSWAIDLSPENVKQLTGVKEAITFTNDQAQKQAVMSDVFLLPGGKYAKSVRNLVRFQEIPVGTDTALFYKGDIPNQTIYAEGTAMTPATHTITTISLTADSVRGVTQEIKQADVEDSPFEITSYLNQAARVEVLEAEATLVYDTAADAATPNLWIRADSGVTVTHDDLVIAAAEPVALRVALQDLETSGYDTSFGNAYCVCHPRFLRDLRGSTNLTTYVQQGIANLTTTGQLSHLYGIELIPSTAVKAQNNTTNDTHRNVVGIKGHTFALASKREILLDMLKIPAKSMYDWAWSQRKNATTFDAASFIRISSIQ